MHRMLIASLTVIVAATLLASTATAGKKKSSYLFDVTAIKLVGDDTPATIETQLAKQLATSIEANERLVAALEEDAPDPKDDPKKFKEYLKKKNLAAFDVHVEVLAYEHSLEKMPEPRTGQMLTVRIQIRMYGITVPGDVLAFSGEGSATIKLELGKKLRKRDTEVANHDAIELAVDGAIADSITKLDKPKKKPSGK